MPKKTVKAFTSALGGLSALNRLKVEVDMLTRYSTDVIYRLCYDTMRYDYISPAVERLLEYKPEELDATPLRSLILETRIVSNGMQQVDSYEGLEETRKRGEVGKWQADYRMRTKSGKEIWVSDISYPWFDKKGAIIGSIGTLRDISDRMQAENNLRDRLERAGGLDEMTELANTETFWRQCEREIQRSRRTQNDLSLLLLELDNYEHLREVYGLTVMDATITSVAGILKETLRDIDVPARLDYASFGIVLPETTSEGAAKTAQRLCQHIARRTYFAGNTTLGCTASIGVATCRSGQAVDAMRLFKMADTRRYIAKHMGGNRFSTDAMAESMH